MYLRTAIAFLGDEWSRLHRMIEALEREAENNHKRHAQQLYSQGDRRKGPANSEASRTAPQLSGNAAIQQNPWGF